MELLKFLIFFFIWIINTQTEAMILKQLNFFVNQNRYQMHPTTILQFQTKFSLDTIMSVSMDLAIRTCQNDFKWERWNCPSTDFYQRHTTKSYKIDREDAYVSAIVNAAAFYTITKDCSSGVFSDCGCDNRTPFAQQQQQQQQQPCSDDPEKAIALYQKHSPQNLGRNFRDLMAEHNLKSISMLLKNSLIRQCGCTANGCLEENCVNVLRPFVEIARDIKRMYDESLQLANGANMRIIWSNIPLDSLVYAAESPDYCDLDVIPHWPGMHGRQCTDDDEENNGSSSSCQHLCYECGYRVRAQNVVTEQNCNCQFTWTFQVQCERCLNVEQQFYCY